MEKYAFFDFDGTIYDGFSINDFIKYVAKITESSWAIDEEKKIIESYMLGKINYQEGTLKIFNILSKLLKGSRVKTINQYAENLIKTNKAKFFSWSIQTIKYLRNNNFRIVLVSASITPIIKAAAKYLKADKMYCSNLIVSKDKYTGQIGQILDSKNKSDILGSLLNTFSSDTLKIGFGDSTGDANMFKKMDVSFVVNYHQKEMLSLSRKEGWNVVNKNNELNQIKRLLESKLKNTE